MRKEIMKGLLSVLLVQFTILLTNCNPLRVEILMKKEDEKYKIVYEVDWDRVVEAAKKEGEVVVAGFGSVSEHDFYRALGREFEKKYKIKFRYQDVGWFKVVQKLKSEKENGVEVGNIDAVLIVSKPFFDGYKEGLWWDVPIVDLIPNAKDIPYLAKYFHDLYPTYGRHVPIVQWQLAMLYNKKWVEEGKMSPPPKSMDQLLDWVKKNPGLFAYCDPNKGGAGHTWLITVAYYINGYENYAFKPFDKKRADRLLKPVFDYLNKLEPYLYKAEPYPGGNKAAIDLLELGEIGMTPMWTSITYQEIKAGRLDPKMVGIYIIEPGMASGGFDGYAIPFNAPHKNAALLWINFMLSKNVQRRIAKEIGAYPILTSAMPKKLKFEGVNGFGIWFPKNVSFFDWRDPLKRPEIWYRNAEYMFYMMKRWREGVKEN